MTGRPDAQLERPVPAVLRDTILYWSVQSSRAAENCRGDGNRGVDTKEGDGVEGTTEMTYE